MATSTAADLKGLEAGLVIDWENLSDCRFSVPWICMVKAKLEACGLWSLVSGKCDLLVDDVVDFYSNMSQVGNALHARVRGVTIRLSSDTLRQVFSFPFHVDAPPKIDPQVMAQELGYVPTAGQKSRGDFRKPGFSGINKVMVTVIGQCLMGRTRSSGADAVTLEMLMCVYCVSKGLVIDWAELLFKHIKVRMTRRRRSFASVISRLIKHQYPKAFSHRPMVPHPSNCVFKKVHENGMLTVRTVAVAKSGRRLMEVGDVPCDATVSVDDNDDDDVVDSHSREGPEDQTRSSFKCHASSALRDDLGAQAAGAAAPHEVADEGRVRASPVQCDSRLDDPAYWLVHLSDEQQDALWAAYGKNTASPEELEKLWISYAKSMHTPSDMVAWSQKAGLLTVAMLRASSVVPDSPHQPAHGTVDTLLRGLTTSSVPAGESGAMISSPRGDVPPGAASGPSQVGDATVLVVVDDDDGDDDVVVVCHSHSREGREDQVDEPACPVVMHAATFCHTPDPKAGSKDEFKLPGDPDSLPFFSRLPKHLDRHDDLLSRLHDQVTSFEGQFVDFIAKYETPQSQNANLLAMLQELKSEFVTLTDAVRQAVTNPSAANNAKTGEQSESEKMMFVPAQHEGAPAKVPTIKFTRAGKRKVCGDDDLRKIVDLTED